MAVVKAVKKRVAKRDFENLLPEDVMFRNFSGRKTDFNEEGDRNFCVAINDVEVANEMNEEGWNIKILEAREEGGLPTHFIKVNVRMDSMYPPQVHLVSGNNIIDLDEESISLLDTVDIKSADVIFRPFTWEDRRTKEIRISAYLEELWIVQEENKYAKKYANMRRAVEVADPDEIFKN